MMLLTIKQIKKIYESLDQFPEAQYVVLESRENSSGIGPSDFAVFQDRGNLFKRIAPKTIGEVEITDVELW
jgi:hypothetical protein